MNNIKIAKQLVKLAKQLMARDVTKLREKGSTMSSLENAKLIAKAGYYLYDCYFTVDKDNQIKDRKLIAIFDNPNGEKFMHVFLGFNVGYNGEGPRGFIEFLCLFNGVPTHKKERITSEYFKPNQTYHYEDIIK